MPPEQALGHDVTGAMWPGGVALGLVVDDELQEVLIRVARVDARPPVQPATASPLSGPRPFLDLRPHPGERAFQRLEATLPHEAEVAAAGNRSRAAQRELRTAPEVRIVDVDLVIAECDREDPALTAAPRLLVENGEAERTVKGDHRLGVGGRDGDVVEA